MGKITMKDLLEAGVHFGHQIRRSNPKMKPYIFTKRKGIHIIDLEKTLELANKAYDFVKDLCAKGGKILFVGTKKQAKDIIEENAKKCGMPYINLRWLGGLLTNFVTIRESIDKLKRIEKILENPEEHSLTKKEILALQRKKEKLSSIYEGIKNMHKLPDALFIIDTAKESTAVREANRLKIPIVGVVDTNGDPTLIDYPIPGNDDAIRAVTLFVNLITDAVIEGQKELSLKAEGAAPEEVAVEEEAKRKEIVEKYDEKYDIYEEITETANQ